MRLRKDEVIPGLRVNTCGNSGKINSAREQIIASPSQPGPELVPASAPPVFASGLRTWKPKLAESVILLRQGDAFCFFRPEIPDWVVGNQNVAAILSRCKGEISAFDLALQVNREHGNLHPEQILAFLAKLKSDHYLFADRQPEHTAYRPCRLNSVHLNLSGACNLKCVYCYAEDRKLQGDPLTRAEYFDILEKLARTGPLTITITGGEPTLNPDWLAISARAKELGHSLMLLTNGIRLTAEEISQAARIFELIKVSIDGSSEHVHDPLRGKGSYRRAMAAVEALLSKNAPVSLSMTVTRRNIDDVTKSAEKYGSLLSYAPLFRAGRAVFRPDLDITGDEYYQALSGAPGVNPMSSLCSILASARNRPIRKCSIGDGEISIGPDGTVYPCHLLHYPEFAAGNIRNTQPADLTDAPAMRLCGSLAVDSIKGCEGCEARYLCGGACRARAYHSTGRIDAADDFCSYEYRAFFNGIFLAYEIKSE